MARLGYRTLANRPLRHAPDTRTSKPAAGRYVTRRKTPVSVPQVTVEKQPAIELFIMTRAGSPTAFPTQAKRMTRTLHLHTKRVRPVATEHSAAGEYFGAARD